MINVYLVGDGGAIQNFSVIQSDPVLDSAGLEPSESNSHKMKGLERCDEWVESDEVTRWRSTV